MAITAGYFLKILPADLLKQIPRSTQQYTNKRLKYDYLYRQHIADIDELSRKFKGFADDYNNRPNNIFNGLSNNEVLNGQDFKGVNFSIQIANAKKGRIIQNKKIKCCFGSF